MNQHTFTRTTGLIFLAIAVLHLLRAIQGWPAVINGWSVPIGLSWFAVVVAGYLAHQAYNLSKR